VKVYLDVSCLNRPFDDQSQAPVRLEAEAVRLILRQCNEGALEHFSSEIATVEIDATPDAVRRDGMRVLLPTREAILTITQPVMARAALLGQLGLKRGDALHVAAAEALQVNVLLSCDDRLCRLGRRRRAIIKVRVEWHLILS
jgi:predicted nucleic acid-binding protein